MHTPYNALRLAKGVFWALLLWPFFAVGSRDRAAAFDRFALGMVLGLAAAILAVLWERLIFPGLHDYSTEYRAVGLFSDVHTGGAFLEGYLVAAAPFLLIMLFWRARWFWWPLAGVLFLLTAYAVAVTFARAGYAGLLVVVMVVLASALWRLGAQPRALAGGALAAVIVGAGGIYMLTHVAQDRFMSERTERGQVESDWQTRMEHWGYAVDPVMQGLRSAVFGLGVGQFPRVYFWDSMTDERSTPAVHSLTEGGGSARLNLFPGGDQRFMQAVSLYPSTEYEVRVVGESLGEHWRLQVAVCELWVLYPWRCVTRNLRAEADDGRQLLEATLVTREPLTRFSFSERPTKLIVRNTSSSHGMILDAVSLQDPSGRELLANGDFSSGLDRWFFTSDDHLAWHIKNMGLQVLFEQGVIGLLLWAALVALALWGALRQGIDPRPQGWAGVMVLAALLSFLTVGMFDSLLDAPRMGTLFFLLIFLALLAPEPPQSSPPPRPQRSPRPRRRRRDRTADGFVRGGGE
ncbi:hypothetical protein [Ectothiorhodospira variabilis]|uniref:hypothetical protein n=1 Tax=Ectothiorhodospira variabilis TaxID=505694 RepID=UPI001EFAA395|nr:hypothetical protein [Ectothiorhodospira variabilis]MCG5497524.1 hypothetical protein [Ectothiorhodospira variabilis]